MKYTIIRLPKTIEYGEGRTKTLHDYNDFLTEQGKFQANGFNLEADDFEEKGLREVDGNQISVFPASFTDKYENMTRGPQTVSRKDIGHIITKTGITNDSDVLDAGAGSGALALYLARIASTVTTMDIDEDNVDIVKENRASLDIENLIVEHGDITDDPQVKPDEYDVVTLDIPDSWEALPTAQKALRIGGYAAIYTPHISQAQQIIKEAPQSLHHDETVEVTATSWDIGERRLRPCTRGVDHTGFLTFLRCIDK